MSIFRRETESSPEPAAPARPSRPASRPPAKQKSTPSGSTHIANGSKVVGRISGSADLVIDGIVEGEIHLESQVVIGSDGRVEGKILARSVEVAGQVLGNVQGGERVEVLATGSLEGDVLSPRVVIAEGAFFKGKVEMTDKIAKPAPAKPAEAAPPKPGGSGPSKPGGSGPSKPGGSGPSKPGGGGHSKPSPHPNRPAMAGGPNKAGGARR